MINLFWKKKWKDGNYKENSKVRIEIMKFGKPLSITYVKPKKIDEQKYYRRIQKYNRRTKKYRRKNKYKP